MTGPQQHFFSTDPEVASSRRVVTMLLSDMSVDLETDSGVFSGDRLDRGTKLLLEDGPRPPRGGEILDLGCGYGPIAIAMATRSPNARVWAVDVNNRALGLTRQNAAQANLSNVIVARPEDVPEDVRFSVIYSNPPIHVGKAALHELLLTWLRRLTVGGVAYMVVNRNLGSDSLAKWLNEQGYPTVRLTSQAGFRILCTSSGAQAPLADEA